MRTKKIPHILFVVFACLLSACVTPEMHDTNEPPPGPEPGKPTKGAMVVNSNWTNRTENVSIPSSFTVELDSKRIAFSSGQTEYPDSIDPGTYNLRLYNTAAGVEVSGSMASLTNTNGTVNPVPEWFFASSSQSVLIAVGETTTVAVTMRQLVKQLTITIEVSGDASRLSEVSGSLSGVAGAVDMNTASVQTAATTNNFSFSRSGDKFVATLRLMGVIGSTQNLTVTAKLTDGTTLDPFVSNVYNQLSTFNYNMLETAGLTNTLSLGVNPEVTGTIGDWEAVDGEDVKIGY